MNKRLLSTLIVLTVALNSTAQTITLEQVLEQTRSNFPLLDQKVVQQEMGKSLETALWNAYIPQLSLDGRVTYQSHVTYLDMEEVEMPGWIPPQDIKMPEIPKLQYQAYLQATQLIWDGGRVAAGTQKIAAESEAQQAEVDVQMQRVEEGVTELYFSLLMLQKQQELQQILINELARQASRVATALRNGAATENDLDQVKVEQVQAEQTSEQLRLSRQAVLDALSVYTGIQLSEGTTATVPPAPLLEAPQSGRYAPRRPEHALLDAKERSAVADFKNFKAGGMPTLALFARGGYGRPGLNMLDPKASPFYLGGVTLSWNFGKLYDYSAQQKKLEGTRLLIELQRQALEREVASKQAQYSAEARQYQALVERDREIVALRKRIAERSKLQESLGTLSTTDYLEQISHYHAAEQTAEVHQLQYLRSLYRQKNNLGL